ncbi:MAG: amino acid adenylation domain-containing protein [Cyclobacteriaceae bacterium]
MSEYTGFEIAVIGVSGRFPGAKDISEFWENLQNGIESVKHGEPIAEADDDNSGYVNASANISDRDCFDSAFFGYLPEEARLMDPQMRIMHECVWHAIEDAGTNLEDVNNNVGLFLGGSGNAGWELYSNLLNDSNLVDSFSENQLANIRFVSGRISYLLNLKGPAIFNDTACSTSLVNIHLACRSLLFSECDIAVAGGITVMYDEKDGYEYKEGMILSKDGHCRAFDENASGTVSGEGVGVVVLKKLSKAIEDRDNIYGVIIGSAINNDGNDKVGFTAPSVYGQAEAIIRARKMARIMPESIGYVEAHGTGTVLGDPIEVEALNMAFGKSKSKYCALGSVKTNIGHLDTAAGVAGFIKAVLAIKNKQIPPTLNFLKPNPKIDFSSSPFYINTNLKKWKNHNGPLRAGVSSFGIGGTNAHLLLQEAPSGSPISSGRLFQILNVSAKTMEALRRNLENLLEYIIKNKAIEIADVAYSLKARASHKYREVVICKNRDEAIELISAKVESLKEKKPRLDDAEIVFMFPGQGSQYAEMGKDLYESEVVFRDEIDRCFKKVKRVTGNDLKSIVFSEDKDRINETEFAQPILFILEYALARLVMHWGVKPNVVIGHSLGEYVAACISGVFSFEDALKLVMKRGELMQKVPGGSMMSILLPVDDFTSRYILQEDLSIAAVNSDRSFVVSGPDTSINSLHDQIIEEGFTSRKLKTSHAFHSSMMDGMLDDFKAVLGEVSFSKQEIPIVSNLKGSFISDSEIGQPDYWVNHLRHTTQFASGVSAILKRKQILLIEVGWGNTLGSFVADNTSKSQDHKIVNLTRVGKSSKSDNYFLLAGLGEIWSYGKNPAWKEFYEMEERSKVPLPGYSFEKTKYPSSRKLNELISSKKAFDVSMIDTSSKFYASSWETSNYYSENEKRNKCLNILFLDEEGAGDELIRRFEQHGEETYCVNMADRYVQNGNSYELNPKNESDYKELFDSIRFGESSIRIVFAWSLLKVNGKIDIRNIRWNLDLGYYALLNILKFLERAVQNVDTEISVITNGLHRILKSDSTNPQISPILGAIRVIPKEYSNVKCKNIDIHLSEINDTLLDSIFKEITSKSDNTLISFRNGTRFTNVVKSINVPPLKNGYIPFQSPGVYLITGGTGGIGLDLAKRISQSSKGITLVLLGRKVLPEKKAWRKWLETHREDDPLFVIIKSLIEIEDNDCDVLYFKVKLEDKKALEKIIKASELSVGPIKGVLHCAGIGDFEGVIHRRSKNHSEEVFAPKIYGTTFLYNALKHDELDFFVLFSSVASLAAPFGQVGYVAANTFMEFFAQSCEIPDGPKVLGIGWNQWREVGMAARAIASGNGIINSDSISPGEGYEIILRCLRSNASVIFVSKSNPNAHLREIEAKFESEDHPITDPSRDNVDSPKSVEKTLTELWSGFFGVEKLGINDDFFELGGDSLKATTLIYRINKSLKTELSLTDFFEKPTIKLLSSHLSNSGDNGSVELKKVEEKEFYPTTSAQRRLFFIQEFDKSSLAYNMPQVIRIEGGVGKNKLEKAFAVLVDKHESLRTIFMMSKGKVMQKVQSFDFEIRRLEGDESELESIVNNFICPFDLRKGPQIRVGLLEISSQLHYLLVDVHHIVSDGTSHTVLIQDFVTLYSGGEIPENALQFKDYSVWRNELDKELLTKNRKFWTSIFDSSLKTINLPTDYQRPGEKSFDGASYDFQLDGPTTAAIKELGDLNGATYSMSLLSIFYVLLSKLTNEEDIVIGTPVSSRSHADLERMIGMFLNTLPMRNSPKENISFRNFLVKVKDGFLSCIDHQDYSYEDLVSDLNLSRNISHNPLFDVLFVFQNFETTDITLPGLLLTPITKNYGISKFDLTLTAAESNGRLKLSFEYSTQLFSETTISKFAKYFSRIVDQVTEDSEQKILDLDLLSESERDELLNEFNDTAVEYPRDKTVVDLFEEQVQRTPDNVALIFEGNEMSYKEFSEQVNRTSYYLLSNGVKKGDIVGILSNRCEKQMIWIFAVLKVGGVFLPIDPDSPIDRMQEIIEDSNLVAIACQSQYVDIAMRCIVPFFLLDDEIQSTAEDLEFEIRGTDLAYIIYTSGSTGKPKGVQIAHISLSNYINYSKEQYVRNNEGSMALFTSVAFDLTLTSIFLPFVSGSTLSIYGREDPEKLLGKILMDENVKILKLTPAHLRLLRNLDIDFGKIETLIVGGEELSKNLATEIYEKAKGNLQIYNEYGPTESTIGSVVYKFCPDPNHDRKNILIGKPIHNTQVYVLDQMLRLSPIGVHGEICIGGTGLAHGYVNSKILTSNKFVSNPHNEETRIYRTGDIGRWLPDGNLEFAGRIDDQVKIRGYRIELEEIAHQLSDHEAVSDAVVVTLGENEDKTLAAYYVPNDSEGYTIKKILEKKSAQGTRDLFELPSGLTLFTNNKSETELLYKEIFTDNSYLKNGISIPSGGCVFDVGANVGMFSIYASLLEKELKIYSFEPIPTTFELLKLNTALYKGEIELFNLGLSDRDGSTQFDHYPNATVLSGISNELNLVRENVKQYVKNTEGSDLSENELEYLLDQRLKVEQIECPIATISTVIRDNNISTIDLLKVDVENAELDVLKGIKDEDWYKIKQIVVEVHDINGRLDEVSELLLNKGYHVSIEQHEELKNTNLFDLYAIMERGGSQQLEIEKEAVDVKFSGISKVREIFRNYLSRKLPEYMIPSTYIPIASIPLTLNGKIDKESLPLPAFYRSSDFTPPDTKTELKLVGIWSKVLQLDGEEISINDNFFELGGHSLKAMLLCNNIFKEFGIEIPLGEVFKKQTILDQSMLIEAVRHMGTTNVDDSDLQEFSI